MFELSFFLAPLPVAIISILLILAIVGGFFARRYQIAAVDEAIVVTGRRVKNATTAGLEEKEEDLSSQKVVVGGGVFVPPLVKKYTTISLRSRQLSLTTEAQTENGITINAKAVANVKVGGTEEMIRRAAQRFASQQDEIENSTQEVLSGSLRGIIGGLTVESIIRDRAMVAKKVLEAAEEALLNQGLVIDTLQIQEISDKEDYIKNLGRPEAAAVLRKAQIADVQAKQAAEEAQIAADASILERDREYKLRQAVVREETDMALAQAEAAKPREDAIQRQRIVEAEEITAQKTASLREAQLNAEIRKVADAEAYRIEKLAEADAAAKIQEAKGKAEATIAAADADKQAKTFEAEAAERTGLAEKVTRTALAEALQAEGEAEAAAIQAKGEAEAKAIEGRSRALAERSEPVLQQELIHTLPSIAKALADGYSNIGNITVVSNDGPTGAITGEIAGGLTSITQAVKSATGIDLPGAVNSAISGTIAGKAAGEAMRKQPSLPQMPNKLVEKDQALSDGEKAITKAILAKIEKAEKDGDVNTAESLRTQLRQAGYGQD